MQIKSLRLFPTTSYHQQKQRQMKTNITQDGLNALEESTRGGTIISPSTVGQVANELMTISAETTGDSNIVNGWSETRYRFVLEVMQNHYGQNYEHLVYIGYTDRQRDAAVATRSGIGVAIDPELMFFVTSVHRVRRTNRIVGGIAQPKMMNHGSSQFLFGSNDLATLDNEGIVNQWTIKPSAVFSQQTIGNVMQEHGLLEGNTIDTTSSLVHHGVSNNRRNNNSATYLYDTFNAYKRSVDSARETGDMDGFITDEALNYLQDNEVYQDPLILAMHEVASDIANKGVFNWRQLTTICPNIDNITDVFDNSQINYTRSKVQTSTNGTFGELWDDQNTWPWTGSDIETVSAAMIANSLPSIMLDNMVMDLRMSITNNTIDGAFGHQIYSANGLVEGIALPSMVQRVIDRMLIELLTYISQNGNFTVNLLIDANVCGDTMINISINGGHPRTYVQPTFADNAASPVLTRDRDEFSKFTHDIFDLTNQVIGRNSGYVDHNEFQWGDVNNIGFMDNNNHIQQPQQPVQQPSIILPGSNDFNTNKSNLF